MEGSERRTENQLWREGGWGREGERGRLGERIGVILNWTFSDREFYTEHR